VKEVRVFKARDCTWKAALTVFWVDRISKSCVWFRGRRLSRDCNDMAIRDSFEDAKAWLTERLSSQISDYERKIKELRDRLELIEKATEQSIPVQNEEY